ncbi:MAG: ribokinase [Actinobacteria bacterium]|nr:MAG: ribokinase [Actinomycetota bacterium]
MRLAVVGHVEWVQFVRVEHTPAPGDIVHALEWWEEPGGGGSVAAVQLAKLGGSASFFTALGDDALGHRAHAELGALGIEVWATFRPTEQRRAITLIDGSGERTITIIGERLGPRGGDPAPWEDVEEADAVYFTAGDDEALRRARRATVLVATSRILPQLVRAGVHLDALVGSGRDPGERYAAGDLDPPPRLQVWTEGKAGGRYRTAGEEEGTYPAAPLPGPVVDAYGCGDSFAAGLTFALGVGKPPKEALALAAACGAACLTGRGPYAGQLLFRR